MMPRKPRRAEGARGALEGVRNRRERAERDMEIAAAHLRAAVVQADRDGVPKTEIAELAGISRQTVYDILAA